MTVQERNPRMQASICDCAEEQPTYRYKMFLKKQEKFTRLSNTEASMNQDKRPHTDFKAKTGQG